MTDVTAGMFQITWDPSVANAPAVFENAFIAAAQYLSGLVTNNVTINVTVGYSVLPGGEASTTTNTIPATYAQIRHALQSRATSATDSTALANLPNDQSDPIGGTHNWEIRRPDAKALGLLGSSDGGADATVTFNSNAPFEYDRSSFLAGSKTDFFSTAVHELSETMGRTMQSGFAGTTGQTSTTYEVFDLFRFATATRARDFVATTPSYFSIDGGNTTLNNFAINPTAHGIDNGDWELSAGADAFTYAAPTRQYVLDTVSPADLVALDVIGWTLAPVAPASLGQITAGGAAIGTLATVGNRDLFQVQLSAGSSYAIDLLGADFVNGENGTLADPYLRLYSAAAGSATLLVQNDDVLPPIRDSELIFSPSSSGTYYIEAGSYADAGTGAFRLLVTIVPTIYSNGGGDAAAKLVAEHTTTVTTVAANDEPGGTLQFSITGGADSSKFAIDRNTGVLSFKSPPAFASPTDSDGNNSYIVQVTASETGKIDPALVLLHGFENPGSSFSDVQDITVNVTHARVGPTITSSANFSIRENSTAIGNVVAIDPEPQAGITYSKVGGADQALLQISSTSGALSFITAPDFDAPTDSGLDNSYVVVVRASDAGLFNDQTITVNVTNVNEPPTGGVTIVGTATRNQVLAANTATLGDPDGLGTLHYQWQHNGGAGFTSVGSDQPTYTLGRLDVATAIRVVVSYTDHHGAAESVASAATAAVGNVVDTLPLVTVSNRTASHGQSFAAVTLFSASDADGDTIAKYGFWDTGSGGGHFVLNGVAQGVNQEIDVTAAQLAQLVYQSGSGADTLWVRVNDGSQWTAWSTGFTVTAPLDNAPVVAAANRTATHGQTSITASSLFTASDADHDTITQYAFWDSTGSGHFVVNGVAQGTAVEIDVTAAQLAQTSYQFGTSTDPLYVRAFDGLMWSGWTSFTAGPFVDRPAVVSVANLTATHNQSLAASSLLTVSDPDGDAIAKYGFWDTGSGGGHFLLNGVAQGVNQEIDVTAAQLAQLRYQSGSGADTLWVRVNDGSQWTAWSTGFTVTAPLDNAPVVAAANRTATHGQTSITASSLFTASDADHDTITQYAFWDSTGSGHFVVNGVAQGTAVEIDVTAAQLAQTSYQFGTSTDPLYVRAFDGLMWSGWTSFTAGPFVDRPAVVSVANLTATHNQSLAASSLLTASDPDGDAIAKYGFWDTGSGGGHFVLNGVAQGVNQEIDVTAAQLAQLRYQSGSGADTLWVRVNDGSQWSAWSTGFTVTAPLDNPPNVTVSNHAVGTGHSVAASSLFTASDPDHDTITQYAFWDSTGSGHFVVNGVAQGAGVEIDVTAGQLAQTTYVAGSAQDQLWMRANDGSQWSSWQSFTAGPTAPVVTVSSRTTVPGQSFAASRLFTASDPDGDPITTYAFWDSTGNGHFVVNGATRGTNVEIDVTAAQLAQTTYLSGLGTDQLWVRANDGSQWSAWQSFNVAGISPAAIGAGSTVELASASAGPVTFTASTGTLKLDASSTFSGTVTGFTAQDTIDLSDINFASVHLATFSGTNLGGSLTVTDGTHTAHIVLAGNYLTSTFTLSNDGHGGTSVVDPPADAGAATKSASRLSDDPVSSGAVELFAQYMASIFPASGSGMPRFADVEPMPFSQHAAITQSQHA